MNEPKTWEQLDVETPDERWWLLWLPRTEVLAQVRALWAGLSRVTVRLNEMEIAMANVSDVLNQVAEKLRDSLSPSIQALQAENARLAADNAELRGEDAAESQAADNVQSAFNDTASLFDQTDEAPTPDPLPEPPAPSDVDTSGESPVA